VVALFFMATGSAWAADPELRPPGPDGIPRAAAGHPWKIYYGARFVDSLDYPQMAVVRAGAQRLVIDHWQIYFVDSTRGVVVSKWKALKHPLVSYFMGKVWMRCVVHIEPLGRNRSRITFRSDMASSEVLTSNPMFGEAKQAYSDAARKYLIKVRQDLYDEKRGVKPRGKG
jgi:hypothetical protein